MTPVSRSCPSISWLPYATRRLSGLRIICLKTSARLCVRQHQHFSAAQKSWGNNDYLLQLDFPASDPRKYPLSPTSIWAHSSRKGWGRSRGASGGEPSPPLASAASRRVGPCTRSVVQRSCTGG